MSKNPRPMPNDSMTRDEMLAAWHARHHATAGAAAPRRARTGPPPIETLATEAQYLGLPAPMLEFQFDPVRRWRFDAAWPEWKIAVEIEGLVYSNAGDNQLRGRHVSVSGFKADIEKYAAAFRAGWYVLRCTSSDARTGRAATWLLAHCEGRGLC